METVDTSTLYKQTPKELGKLPDDSACMVH